MNEKNALEKLHEYRKIIGRVLEAFRGVSFPLVVEVATNTKVEPFDLKDEKDAKLVQELSMLADIIIRKFYEEPIQIKRINEVSNFLEKQLPKIFAQKRDQFQTIKTIEHLSGVGYPDEEVLDIYGRVTYMEIKGTTRPETGSARDFYFTPGAESRKKIRANARHALSSFIITGIPNAFKTIGWKLVDLSKITVSMKPEFNADNTELYRKETVIAERYITEL